ncbi:MAG: diguanylate cyclase [Desulfotomaculaceae bacterium]|nr:diguanylate cyclase [Desulfotomaculaceae bacterium]
MKKSLALSILICVILLNPLIARGESLDIHPDSSGMFDETGISIAVGSIIVILLILLNMLVKRREAQKELTYEHNKYLQTLTSIGDGVMVVGQDGKIEMLNKVAQKLTGWTFPEAQGMHYKDVFVLSHEHEGYTIVDPIEGVFATDMIQELGNHAMLTSRDGTKYNLEDSAAPIKNETNTTVGIVLVFRDVTDKKAQRKKIEYLSFHDSLTGLYNRRFFEEELLRLDTARNLPLSIIMGDVNELKLTNDIFGHAYGDMLLKKVAEVLQNVCRADDIIARWGGDEFVILLPKTHLEETEKIVARIKGEFATEQIKAIKGSISMGFYAKQDITEDLMQVLYNAEEKMYSAKALERDKVRRSVIDSIITTLHQNSPREKNHSLRVSELCQELGRALKLPEVELRKLKEAGYLHDIGKIVLEPKLLNKDYPLTNGECKEMNKHSIVGYRILNSFDDTVDLAELVLAHHEQWDGHGYPKGLKGEEIPLLARIIAVAESYDRIIYDSANNKVMSKADAVGAIRENAGTQFDPKIVELLGCFILKNLSMI